jgi:uncharacterized protein (DUF488 family)
MIDAGASRSCLFTIGHSDHELSRFLLLLRKFEVDVIADVRSQPYSRFHAQFNRETLAKWLSSTGITYVFLGRELGARRAEPQAYQDRQARYDLIRRLPAFREGLDVLRRQIVGHRVSLLCAERDPITCHRTILVCRQLRGEGVDILHIREDGSAETTAQIEDRLIEAAGLPPAHLFLGREELVEQAYELQAERIAYTQVEATRVRNEEVA